MSDIQQLENVHPPKRSRIGERTLLACVGCKKRKLKVCYNKPSRLFVLCYEWCGMKDANLIPIAVRWPESKVPKLHQDESRYSDCPQHSLNFLPPRL